MLKYLPSMHRLAASSRAALASAFDENSTKPIPFDLPSSLFVKILTLVTVPQVAKYVYNESSVELQLRFLTNNSLWPAASATTGVGVCTTACLVFLTGATTSSSDDSSSLLSALTGAFLTALAGDLTTAFLTGTSSLDSSSELAALTGAFLTTLAGDLTTAFLTGTSSLDSSSELATTTGFLATLTAYIFSKKNYFYW